MRKIMAEIDDRTVLEKKNLPYSSRQRYPRDGYNNFILTEVTEQKATVAATQKVYFSL